MHSSSKPGALLFINHDAASLKAKVKRDRVINSHVQHVFHQRQRRENIKLFHGPTRATGSLGQPSESQNEIESSADDEKHISNRSTSSDPVQQPFLPTLSHQGSDKPPTKDSYRYRRDQRRHANFQTSPLTILMKGNSDPFGTLAIDVDPVINSLMAFGKDYLLPSLRTVENACGVSLFTTSAFHDALLTLHDQCRAYGCLSWCAMNLASLSGNPKTTRIAQELEGHSTALLRKEIRQQGGQHDVQTCKSIFWLLAVELAAQNFAVASIHARMLSKLLQTDKTLAASDLPFLRAVLYMDLQLATLSLTKPAFDDESWIEEHLQASWQKISRLEGRLSLMASARILDPSVDVFQVRAVFQETMKLVDLVRLLYTDHTLNHDLFIWIATRSIIAQGKLLNLYHLFSRRAHNAIMHGDSGSFESYHAHVFTFVCLSALYLTRTLSGFDKVPVGPDGSKSRSRMFQAGPKLLEYMRKSFLLSEGHSLNSSPEFQRIRLWSLYTCAGAEEANSLNVAERGFHHAMFATQVKKMGLISWYEVEKVLEGFFYVAEHRPGGSEWFEKTMNAGLSVEPNIPTVIATA